MNQKSVQVIKSACGFIISLIFLGLMGLVIGGKEAAIGIYLAVLSIAACWIFWLSFYFIGKKLSNKLGCFETFRITYFILLSIFILVVLGWSSSDRGICPPGAYGDYVCVR